VASGPQKELPAEHGVDPLGEHRADGLLDALQRVGIPEEVVPVVVLDLDPQGVLDLGPEVLGQHLVPPAAGGEVGVQLSWRQICSKNCRSTCGFGLSLKYTAASKVKGTLSDDGAEMKSARLHVARLGVLRHDVGALGTGQEIDPVVLPVVLGVRAGSDHGLEVLPLEQTPLCSGGRSCRPAPP